MKIEKPKRKKKTERKLLDKQILDLWASCIKTRQKTCRATNSDYRLSAHHIIGRSYRWGRYALDNGLLLSWRVHSLQKSHPEQFRDKVLEIIGEKEFNRLKKAYMYREPCKRTITELRGIKEELKAELKQIQSDWGK